MAARGGVEKLLEEVHISSASWLGDELLTAMSSEDISGGEIGLGGDDSDLDDLSSLSFSDSVQIPGNGMPDRPNFLYYGGTASKVVEAEEMKRESQRHSSELQMQNHELRHQNDILGMKLQHAQRRHSEEAARMRHALTAEVAASVERHKQETSVLREQLSARQDTLLGALRISEREYEEIAATPAQQRDLRQTIAAEAYLLLAVARRSLPRRIFSSPS
ncbi:hypothetical protein T484DRAFT_1834065 [Baffinella frigidus]|nr:hypothetical protein T484DRAFT_1834065 [Cryptophyta sp. CCMP2293]